MEYISSSWSRVKQELRDIPLRWSRTRVLDTSVVNGNYICSYCGGEITNPRDLHEAPVPTTDPDDYEDKLVLAGFLYYHIVCYKWVEEDN